MNKVYPERHWVQTVGLVQLRQFKEHPWIQVEFVKYDPSGQERHIFGLLELWQVKQFDEHVIHDEPDKNVFG